MGHRPSVPGERATVVVAALCLSAFLVSRDDPLMFPASPR